MGDKFYSLLSITAIPYSLIIDTYDFMVTCNPISSLILLHDADVRSVVSFMDRINA